MTTVYVTEKYFQFKKKIIPMFKRRYDNISKLPKAQNKWCDDNI